MKALRDPEAPERWAATLDEELRSAFEAAVAGAKGLRLRDQGDARMRFSAKNGVTVDLRVDPKPNGKSSLAVQNMKLRAAGEIDRYRAAWKEAFAALARQLAG